MTYELGIVGAGNMAEAIARGAIAGGIFQSSQIIAADVSPQRRALFTQQLGIRAVEANADVVRQSKRILLSVKPQQMAEALAGMGQVMDPQTLVISIAAGISTKYIQQHLGERAWRVIRVMPNTPMLVGEGMAAMCGGMHATSEDLVAARRIFEAAAAVIEVSEHQMDAVTALSGSGPAYLFYLVEQMIRAGTEMGLTAEQSHTLATQTAYGAAKMLLDSADAPQELRRKVTSPGGTTQAAISYLQDHGYDKIVIDAVKAAQRRSGQLGV